MSKSEGSVKKSLRRYSSPIFLVMLVLSFLFWYIRKLSYTYTTQIPVTVYVMDQQFKINCVAQGQGYNLFTYKYLLKTKIDIKKEELLPAHDSTNNSTFVINSFALQNAISLKLRELRIVSVDEPPEIREEEPSTTQL